MLDTDKKLILKQFEKYFTMVIKKNSREILIKSASNNRYFSEDDAGQLIVNKIIDFRDDLSPKEIISFVLEIIKHKRKEMQQQLPDVTPKIEIFNEIFEKVKKKYGVTTNEAMTKISCSSDGITKNLHKKPSAIFIPV